MPKNNSNKLADVLFPNINEEDVDILDIPANERKLRTETYDFSVATIVDFLKKGNIVIPDFQRGFVWGQGQASRLIESLIINCPIPVIYLSQDKDEVLSVIDGNQRLNSIYYYLEDKYELKGLTTFPDLDGLKYSQLDSRIQRHILNRTLRCICILKDTHPQIKFDVFERLNTGSVKLSPHELRHGLYMGTLMTLLRELTRYGDFKKLTNTKNDSRMKGDELILRFFAFKEGWRVYKKPMSSFLNHYCAENRNISEDKSEEISNLFKSTLDKITELLGNNAFKTVDEEHKKPKFNAALYDAQMVAVSELNLTSAQIQQLLNNNFVDRNFNFISSEPFLNYISSSTTDKVSVQTRITNYIEFIQNNLR